MYVNNNVTTEELSVDLKELSESLETEELFRKLKSSILWLREGDMNSKFFHNLTKQKWARNRITWVMDSSGNMVEDEEGMVAIGTSYLGVFLRRWHQQRYMKLSGISLRQFLQKQTKPSQPWLRNERLNLRFLQCIRTKPLDQMEWVLFLSEILGYCEERFDLYGQWFFISGYHSSWTEWYKHLSQFEKKNKPTNVAQFRPISLFNVSNRIISNILCPRLKKVLPERISETH